MQQVKQDFTKINEQENWEHMQKINSTNNCFQNKNTALKIISKVEAKTWTAGRVVTDKILTAQAQPPTYLVPCISKLLNEQFVWHLDMARFLINSFFTG